MDGQNLRLLIHKENCSCSDPEPKKDSRLHYSPKWKQPAGVTGYSFPPRTLPTIPFYSSVQDVLYTHLMTCREGKNGLWSLSQPMKALVLCDSAVSSSGSRYCEREGGGSAWKKKKWLPEWTDETVIPSSRQFIGKLFEAKQGSRNSVNAEMWVFIPGYQARQHSWELPGLVWGSWGCNSVQSTNKSPFWKKNKAYIKYQKKLPVSVVVCFNFTW